MLNCSTYYEPMNKVVSFVIMPRFAKRFFRYYYLRLVRQTGSADYISRGVAIGLFIGLLIPMGGQMAIALALAYLLKGHKVPALACTWVTNHFTIGIIYPIQCYIGSYFTSQPMDWAKISNIFEGFIKSVTETEGMGFKESLVHAFNELVKLGSEVLVPFFIGGALIGTILAIAGYFLSYGMITHHRMKKDMKIKSRLASKANQLAKTIEEDKVCNDKEKTI